MRHSRLAQLVQRQAIGVRWASHSGLGSKRQCLSNPSHRPVRTVGRQYASPALATREDVISHPPEARHMGAGVVLLHDIKDLVQNGIGGSGVWLDRLEELDVDLQTPRRPRIAIVGDDLSGVRSLVSSLLQDPISDTTASRQALLGRHDDANRAHVSISYGTHSSASSPSLQIPSTWLQNSGCEILEVLGQDMEHVYTTALQADTLALVLDPIRLSSTKLVETLRPFLSSGRPIIVIVNGSLPESETPSTIQERIQMDLGPVQVAFTESRLALKALDSLSEGLQRTDATPSSRSKAFETFQHAYLKSNIGELQSSLSGSFSEGFQTKTAASTLSLANEHVASTLAADRLALETARSAVTELRKSARHATTHAKNISVINRAIEGGRIEGGVDDEVARARHEIQNLFDGKYSWLGLVGRLRVDDVGTDMAAYIDRQFGSGLEKQIVYESGQLSQVRHNLEAQTDATVRKLSNITVSSTPLASPLLVNRLSTISLSIPSFSPTTLVSPLQQRRQQLVDISTNRLQRSASRALLATYGLAFSGILSSWWAYVPPVAAISSTTAIGLGLLSIVSSAAVGQNRWARAQHSFWQEWDRITRMLRGDLQQAFASALETRVVAKTDAAADGLDRLVQKREQRLDELEAVAKRVRSRIDKP